MHEKKKALICVGAGKTQLPLIIAAKKIGYFTIAIDRNPKAVGFKYASSKICESTSDKKSVLAKLKRLESKFDFCGVICRSNGKALYTASDIASNYGLNGLPYQLVKIATEKSTLREFCTKHQIPKPKGVRVKRVSEIPGNLSFPVVVKPDSTIVGKKGIFLVSNFSKLRAKVEEAKTFSVNGNVEIEKFIDGIDVCLLIWSRFGKVHAVTTWDELVGIELARSIKGLGVSIPSVVKDTHTEKQMIKVASVISRAFPQINTFLLLSFRVDWKRDSYLIEIHADLGGDLIGEKLLPTANPKFDFFEIAILIALGKFNLSQIEAKFKPVSLVYERGSKKQKIAYIYKSNQLKVNLEKTYRGISSTFELLRMPNHYQWWVQSQQIVQ